MLPDITCGVVGDDGICCETFWNQANHVLRVVAEHVQPCLITNDCCQSNMYVYVSQGEPVTWEGDYLAIWLTSVVPSLRSFTAPQTLTNPQAVYRVNWSLRLCEAGYPMMGSDQTGAPTIPGFDEQHYANRFVYSHGEMMLRGLLTAVQSNNAAPQGPTGFQLTSFNPFLTERGSAGYQVNFSLAADWQAG